MKNQLLINGEWKDGVKGQVIDVVNPYDGSLITQVAEATEEDVNLAVSAAKAAFIKWSSLTATERGRYLLKLADLIEERAEELAQLETLDTGHPIRDTRFLDVRRTADTFRYFGGMADKLEGTVVPVESGFINYVQHKPIGVVGQIVPWNFPLMFTSWKMAPALAAGNTIVIKPSELTPLSTLKIAEMMLEVGIPAGVVNVVVGYGHTAGNVIATHNDVGKVAFTGSTETGKKIIEASASNIKKVQLELGGKGANIIFEDANIDAAVNGSAFAIFHNQGQACIAGSRIIIHEKVKDAFLAKFLPLAESIKLGDPKDPTTEMGPLTSKMHLDRVLAYIEIAKSEGSTVLTGGCQPIDPSLANGYFVKPTVVEAKPHDRVFQEEVFGPFVSITTFSTDEEALKIANATEYGLGSGLWTTNLSRAHKFAESINAGMVWINCYKRVNPGSPFGGVGKSGFGREMGFDAMREYTETKSVWVNYDAKIPPFYPRGE
jgi:aldehyde dehydrogenase (NAD+)